MKNCDHMWISNSGKGGVPLFEIEYNMSNVPIMHVKCTKCGARTWFTQQQWRVITCYEETSFKELP